MNLCENLSDSSEYTIKHIFQGPPVCTSAGSLCGLNYRYVTEDDIPIDILNSEKEICQCPENITCSSGYDWENMTNSLVYRLLTHGMNNFQEYKQIQLSAFSTALFIADNINNIDNRLSINLDRNGLKY